MSVRFPSFAPPGSQAPCAPTSSIVYFADSTAPISIPSSTPSSTVTRATSSPANARSAPVANVIVPRSVIVRASRRIAS